jgi:cellulose synthase/poly-beta-1,6-N-acetylglucosamine synthase-like glycosyltransferase
MPVLFAVCSVVFYLSLLFVLYVYAGFPLCLTLIAGRRRRPAPDMDDAELPSVSLVIAAYNEETVIERKILNGLSIEYPQEKLQFVFVSDSTDRTNEILARYESERVKACLLPERRGKVAALHEALKLCNTDLVVMSDANTWYRPDSIRKLARHFRDPEIGVVTGDVRILPTAQPFGAGEGAYYKYERALQALESRFWSTVAIDGAMYAIRRDDVRFPASGLIADDFVTAMNVGLRGLRIIYDPEAIAEEDPTPTDGQEFARKIRVVAYAIQSFLKGEGRPEFRQFRLWWTYMSHKLLRWFVPVFLLFALLSNLVAALVAPVWRSVLAAHLAMYAAALIGWKFPSMQSRLFRVPYYFVLVNTAAFLGIWRGIRSRQSAVWVRTERVQQA